ncbi:MAG: hypothetical protein KKB37_10670 [Alphaproteobacteria bacterium]|nr:hypothetical protein [Alphaproteobacteria bacterium]
MLIATSTAEARQRQRQVHVNGHDYTLSEYVGAAPLRGAYLEGNEVNDNGMPQGFLVEQPPGSVTLPHFHETNQFQVFVDGIGSMGKHRAEPLTVQYANGHTPYGPIKASETGIKYFTLRQRWDPGAKYMPGARDKLRKGNQRTCIKASIPLTGADDRTKLPTAPAIETIFAREDDGMAAWLYRFAPGSSTRMPPAVGTGGQYLVVASGELDRDGRLYDKWSTLFVTADEPAPTITASSAGLDLLVLQFPTM